MDITTAVTSMSTTATHVAYAVGAAAMVLFAIKVYLVRRRLRSEF